MEARKRYTATIERRVAGVVHSASVALIAAPCAGDTRVRLSEEVIEALRQLFGPHFEHGRHCVWSGVAAQIDMANVAGEMPRVGRSRFSVEVVEVQLSSGLGWRESGWLLGAAAMDAVAAYLHEYEAQASEERSA
ncbi:MAG TPA: hypothetical protein VIL46_06510 [Gemmataceae bacterium]